MPLEKPLLASNTTLYPEEVDTSNFSLNDDNTSDAQSSKTFKDFIKELLKNQVYCFETRNGERGEVIGRDIIYGIVGIGAWLLSKTIYRFSKVRYLNYLYIFDKDNSSFFITFRKRFVKGTPSASHEISEFGITLSKLDESPENCIGVALKYDQVSKRIKLGMVELLTPINRTISVYTKNELLSDIFNSRDTAQNMIITQKLESVGLTDEFNKIIQEIKKVNYDDFLRAAKAAVRQEDSEVAEKLLKTAEGYYLDPMTDEQHKEWLKKHEAGIANDPNWGGGSTRKNKYMSRNTSRKRRLYRKKSRKGKKVYKKLRSHKITKK